MSNNIFDTMQLEANKMKWISQMREKQRQDKEAKKEDNEECKEIPPKPLETQTLKKRKRNQVIDKVENEDVSERIIPPSDNAVPTVDDEKEDRTVFVGNLSLGTSKKKVSNHFLSCGVVEAIRFRSLPTAGIAVPDCWSGRWRR